MKQTALVLHDRRMFTITEELNTAACRKCEAADATSLQGTIRKDAANPSDFWKLSFICETLTDEPTCLVDVLLARVPDAGVEAAEEEAVVARLPAVVHLVLVRLVHAVVDAVVLPLLAAVGLGHALGALAPVRGDEGGGGEEERHQVQAHRQQRATFARGLHAREKVHPTRCRSAEESHGAAKTHGETLASGRIKASCGAASSRTRRQTETILPPRGVRDQFLCQRKRDAGSHPPHPRLGSLCVITVTGPLLAYKRHPDLIQRILRGNTSTFSYSHWPL